VVSTRVRYHVVELSRPEAGWQELEALSRRARAAADELRADGTQVRFLRSIFEPESGNCFLLLEAPTEEEAGLVVARADLVTRSVVATTQANGGEPC
jgi:hypothetical protein